MHNDMVESPYMQYAVKCKMPEILHGVVHVDGTSRVQTVKKCDAPRLHDLLLRWGKATGHPVLLNTSLNVKGEPILNDEDDCVRWSKQHNVRIFS
jgi:carbamoyltransferase